MEWCRTCDLGQGRRLPVPRVRLAASEASLLDHDRYSHPPLATRQRFGRTLTAWCNRNGWIHSTLHEWGEQAGFPAVRDSTFNKLQNAKTDQPQPLTFIQLGLANARIAEGDYSGVTDRRLKDRLKDSQPITTAKGKPWSATDFFSHFIGELEAPEWLQQPEPLSEEEAKELSAKHQQAFEELAKANMLSPAVAWKQLEQHCSSLTNAQRDLLRNVLSGWHQWTPSEWEAITANGSDPVGDALAEWGQSLDH